MADLLETMLAEVEARRRQRELVNSLMPPRAGRVVLVGNPMPRNSYYANDDGGVFPWPAVLRLPEGSE